MADKIKKMKDSCRDCDRLLDSNSEWDRQTCNSCSLIGSEDSLKDDEEFMRAYEEEKGS